MALGLASAFTGQPASPGTNPPPQGLLDLILGQNNPIAQFVDSRRNVVGALGAGIASSPNFGQGLANAAQNLPQARQADYAQQIYLGQIAQTRQYLKANGFGDLEAGVASGAYTPQQAMQMASERTYRPPVVMTPGSYLGSGTNGAPLDPNVDPSAGGEAMPGQVYTKNPDGTITANVQHKYSNVLTPLKTQGGGTADVVPADAVGAAATTTAQDVAQKPITQRALAPSFEGQALNDKTVLANIDKVLPLLNDPSATGAASQVLGAIGSTSARDAQALIDNIKANIGLDTLQQLRDNAPNGSNLLRTTQNEFNQISSSKANLDQAQTVGQLRDQLNLLKRIVQENADIRKVSWQRDFGSLKPIISSNISAFPPGMALQAGQPPTGPAGAPVPSTSPPGSGAAIPVRGFPGYFTDGNGGFFKQ